MKRNLKEQIIQLHKEGKSNREIVEVVNCSYSTIAYYLYEKTKETVRKKNIRRRELSPEKYGYKTWNSRDHLRNKVTQFHRIGHRRKKITFPLNFTVDDLILKIGSDPKCYLTGSKIDLAVPSQYSLDHVIPVSKNGPMTLENLSLCKSDVNRAKSDKTPEEFFALCKQVLEYNGYTVQRK